MKYFKRLFFFLILGVVLTSCGFDEPIIFKGVDGVQVNGIKDNKLNLSAKALFHNPNTIGGKLKRVDIAIKLEDETLAEIVQRENLRIEKESDFIVPFTAQVSMQQLKQGFMGNLMAILGRKTINLRFVGNIKVSSFGVTRTVPVDFESEVQF